MAFLQILSSLHVMTAHIKSRVDPSVYFSPITRAIHPSRGHKQDANLPLFDD
jgi:hypothetical protein